MSLTSCTGFDKLAEWEARVEMRVSAFEDVPSVTEARLRMPFLIVFINVSARAPKNQCPRLEVCANQ